MKRELTYDVVVVGGGASGVAAAVGAADTGKKVLLVERNPYLGGQATNSLVPAYCGFCTSGKETNQVIKGVGQELLNRMHDIGYFDDFTVNVSTGNRIVPQDPEITKILLEDMLNDHHVDFILSCTLVKADTVDGIINSITCLDDEGEIVVFGKSFVDASGDANLSYLSGAPVEFHHEQKGALMFRMSNVESPECLSPASMEEAINKAIENGAYGFSAKKGIAVRVPHTNDYLVNMIGLDFENLDARTLTRCESEGRRQAKLYADAFKKYIKGMENSVLTLTGPKTGLRESRRIVGEYTLTKEDVKTSKKNDTSIGRGGWGAEVHRLEDNGEASWAVERNEKYFDIPLGTLIPKGMKNLWCAGRIISSDLVASASIRVMGTGFASGHGAGVAAGLAIDNKKDIKEIQAELRHQGALI